MIIHPHVKSGDDSLNGITVIGQTIFVKNWLWRPLVFLKLLKINTCQAYATSYPHKKFGDDFIFITFPLIDRTSSKF